MVIAVLIGLLLAYNSAKRIVSYKGTAQKVVDAQNRLEALKAENEQLKHELDYKKSDKFAEEEIRNKLGLAKPGEEVYVVPKENSEQLTVNSSQSDKTNWQKWKDYLWGE